MSIWKAILVGTAGTVLGACIVHLTSCGNELVTRVVEHVDDPTPVKKILKRLTTQEEATLQIDELDSRLQQTVSQLADLRAELANQPVRGPVWRELGKPRQNENLIYVNLNSEADAFDIDELVDVTLHGRTVRARVAGTIRNKRDDVLGQLNVDAAEAVGLTEFLGTARVRLQRAL